jgi:chromosome segregation ATPase
VRRIEKRIFRINDQIKDILRELEQTRAELEYHRSIDEDAQRDAAVGNYIDREEAGLTRGDVRRFERTIEKLIARKEKLEDRRVSLLERLPD